MSRISLWRVGRLSGRDHARRYTVTDTVVRTNEFLKSIIPGIYKSNAHIRSQPIWWPTSANITAQEFYKSLKIPLLNERPSLLLHRLKKTASSPIVKTLEKGSLLLEACETICDQPMVVSCHGSWDNLVGFSSNLVTVKRTASSYANPLSYWKCNLICCLRV